MAPYKLELYGVGCEKTELYGAAANIIFLFSIKIDLILHINYDTRGHSPSEGVFFKSQFLLFITSRNIYLDLRYIRWNVTMTEHVALSTYHLQYYLHNFFFKLFLLFVAFIYDHNTV